MELVRAGLGAHEDLGAHAVAVFGGHVVGHDLELADGIDGRLGCLGLEAQRASGIAGRVVGTVEQHVGLRRVHADRQNAALAASHAVVARALAHFAGRQHADGELRQLEVVAPVERHLENALGVDDLTNLGLLGLDQYGGRIDLHGLGDGTDRHRAVNAHGLLHLKANFRVFPGREPV